MQLNVGRAFLQSAARDFKRTGAVAPSSRALASAMTEALAARNGEPVSVLEVGAGSGSVTLEIAKYLQPQDRLEIFEIDEGLAALLRERIQRDRRFSRVSGIATVHAVSISEIDASQRFDFIISCLPFTNFEPHVVRQVLELYQALLRPGGTVSFYEYVLVRRAAQFMSGNTAERRRVDGVGRVVQDYVRRFGCRREIVLFNLPPAKVHHLKFTPGA